MYEVPVWHVFMLKIQLGRSYMENQNSRPDDMMILKNEDDKWFGVPPKGERQLPGKWRYISEILAIILIEFVLWGIYRVVSAPYISPFGSMKFYIAHFIAAPTIHLIPIILYWKFYRKEKGHPFTFTRKRLMSGIMIGLISAVVWRVLEMLVGDSLSGIAGGTVFGTLGFYSVLDTTTVLLFGIMTFTHFVIVGPVEELEFRSFTQDQAARVLTNWQALTFASVLFGLSHIPIAITVYRMPLPQLLVAEIGWITAGAVFGALYMWSRNIFACIIMHGMGNWQLSVFFFQSRLSPDGMSTMTSVVMGTLTSVIVNTAMIALFYLIYKYYWQPQRQHGTYLKGPFRSVRKMIFKHDLGGRPLLKTIFISVVFCVIGCGFIMSITAALGETDFTRFAAISKGDANSAADLGPMVTSEEILSGSGNLNEGQFDTIVLTSESEKYIQEVTVTVTWTDETGIPRDLLYENLPDTFSVTVNGPNATDTASGANPSNGQGEISAAINFSNEGISNIISQEGVNYTGEIIIKLEAVGDYKAKAGPGPFAPHDTGNRYDYEVIVTWLVPE